MCVTNEYLNHKTRSWTIGK